MNTPPSMMDSLEVSIDIFNEGYESLLRNVQETVQTAERVHKEKRLKLEKALKRKAKAMAVREKFVRRRG